MMYNIYLVSASLVLLLALNTDAAPVRHPEPHSTTAVTNSSFLAATANFPPASNILNYGYDFFGGDRIGDMNGAKSQIFIWQKSQQPAVSLKDGSSVMAPKGWDVLPTTGCSSESETQEITENSFSSSVKSSIVSQLRERSSVVTHSSAHESAVTSSQPGLLDVLGGLSGLMSGFGNLAGGLAKAGAGRRLLGGSSTTTTDSNTVGWTDLAGSSMVNSQASKSAEAFAQKGFSHRSSQSSYGSYYRLRMSNYDSNLMEDTFDVGSFDPEFKTVVLRTLQQIGKQRACRGNATRCWEYAGNLMHNYGQFAIVDALMGYRRHRTVFYSGSSTEAQRSQCNNALQKNASWTTDSAHATNTGNSDTAISACQSSGGGGSAFAESDTSEQIGLLPGCTNSGSSAPASPVPVRSSLMLLSALPLHLIKGVGKQGQQVLQAAMNQWFTNAVLGIKSCSETLCQRGGKDQKQKGNCWGEWSSNSKGQWIITPSGKCKYPQTPAPTPVPTPKPTAAPTNKPTVKPTVKKCTKSFTSPDVCNSNKDAQVICPQVCAHYKGSFTGSWWQHKGRRLLGSDGGRRRNPGVHSICQCNIPC